MKKENREFLMDEYRSNKLKPQFVTLNGEQIIIPCEYALGCSQAETRKKFLIAFFDLQKNEYEKYCRAEEKPRIIESDGIRYIVPFRLRHNELTASRVIENIHRRCCAKYERAISLTRKMAAAFPERGYTVEIDREHVQDMQAFYRGWLFNKYKDETLSALVRSGEFVAAGARSLFGRIPQKQLEALYRKTRVFAVGAAATALTAAGGYGIYKSGDKASSAQEPRSEQLRKATEEAPSAKSAKQLKLSGLTQTAQQTKVTAAKPFNRTAAQKQKLFEQFLQEIFQSEGGYADKSIDQPTNMGIIQPTLEAFAKSHPDVVKKHAFPKSVKKLTRSQAGLIYKYNYFDHYRIGDYRNRSIGLLIFDIYVNHEPKSAKLFIEQALKAARKAGADIRLPTTTGERVSAVNSLASSPEYEKAFYQGLMKERKFHMYKKTTLREKRGEVKKARFAAGLRNRANKYDKRYVSTFVQEQGTAQKISQR